MPLGFPRPSLRKKIYFKASSFTWFPPLCHHYSYFSMQTRMHFWTEKYFKKKDGVLMLISNAMQVKRLLGKAQSTIGGLKKQLQSPCMSGQASWVQTEERESFACYRGGSRNNNRLSLTFSLGGPETTQPVLFDWWASWRCSLSLPSLSLLPLQINGKGQGRFPSHRRAWDEMLTGGTVKN